MDSSRFGPALFMALRAIDEGTGHGRDTFSNGRVAARASPDDEVVTVDQSM